MVLEETHSREVGCSNPICYKILLILEKTENKFKSNQGFSQIIFEGIFVIISITVIFIYSVIFRPMTRNKANLELTFQNVQN